MIRWLMRLGALLAAAVPGAVLAASCGLSASGVAFGNYPLFSAVPTDSTGTVVVTCTGAAGELVSYRLSLGTGGGTGFGSRRMTSPASPFALAYNLYTDAARSVVWGDGSGSSLAAVGALTLPVGGSGSVTSTIYGRIPARQNVMPGIYGDTIVVTVAF